jgi:hypothetical protein
VVVTAIVTSTCFLFTFFIQSGSVQAYHFTSQLHCSMKHIGHHATRSKGIAAASIPWKAGTVPIAVRKLQSKGESTFKPSGCRLPSTKGCNDSVKSDDNMSSSAGSSTSDEEASIEDEKPEDYFRFIGETEATRGLITEAAVCRACKKGTLVVSFETKCLATSIHTWCGN